MPLFLIVCEPLKHINMVSICASFIFICTHDTTIDFGMILLIGNSSLNLEINPLHSFLIVPFIVNLCDGKLPCLM